MAWMSTPMSQTPERENGLRGESSEPLPPELALRLSKELPSSQSLGIDAKTPSLASGSKTGLSSSEPRLPLTPSTSSLSKSRSPSNLRPQSRDRSSVSSRGSSPSLLSYDSNQEHRQIIVRSFAPRVAVYASADTEELVRQKGFEDGLCSLVRPYGELLPGKVFIRDSVGASKGFDDFGIRFINSGNLQPSNTNHIAEVSADSENSNLVNSFQYIPERPQSSHGIEPGASFDQFLDHCLHAQAKTTDSVDERYFDYDRRSNNPRPDSSPLYPTYLRKLLANETIVPYETFSHPVACMIAVSSHHPAPIEALRQLYASTGHGSNNIPAWVGTGYLRYYVLIHDEERDDITKSTALFDLMKRHFGLHCHLLRLRSSQCVPTEDDSTKVPSCEWLSAEEEMNQIRTRGRPNFLSLNDPALTLICEDYTEGFEVSEKYILESDATAIRALLREMVAQSIVPFMESRVITWNDQVASRRRGISGRFMSLSKRWTGFGSPKSAVPGPGGTQNSSGSNYDYQRGFYPPETPEASMRQLGDYAFMLRDWRLAYSTYDFLRTDFSHDKAWSYHAATNEMAAITSLLIPQASSSRPRSDNIDQMLDAAMYSYITRCAMPSSVARCLTLAMELLRNRGINSMDDTAKWGGKLLEFGVLTPIAQALATERIADCYMSRASAGASAIDTRRRQAALWNVLSADSWMRLDKAAQARLRLREASALFYTEGQQNRGPPFPSMQAFWQRLEHALREGNLKRGAPLIDTDLNGDDLESSATEEAEQLNAFTRPSDMANISTEGFTPQDAGRPNSRDLDDPQSQSDEFE